MTQCVQLPLFRHNISTVATPDGFFVGWKSDDDFCRHLIQFDATGSDVYVDMEILQRLWIHILADKIPASGFVEAVESLQQIADFHQPRAARFSLPAPVRSIPANVVGTTVRPIVPIETE